MIGAEGTGLHHDDELGEAVHPRMEERIQLDLMTTLLRHGRFDRPIFPGSQPVSYFMHLLLWSNTVCVVPPMHNPHVAATVG